MYVPSKACISRVKYRIKYKLEMRRLVRIGFAMSASFSCALPDAP